MAHDVLIILYEPVYQYQHLSSDIHRFQACSSVFLKLEVPGLFPSIVATVEMHAHVQIQTDL